MFLSKSPRLAGIGAGIGLSFFATLSLVQVALTQPAYAQTLLRGPGAAALDPMFQDVLKKPNNVELNLAFARRAIELEDFEAAVATLERLLIGRSGLPLIRLELGMLYLRLEAPELAEAYFLQVLEVPDLEAEPRQRAEILLAETRRASRKGSFALSSSLGFKHSSNAVTKPQLDDAIEQNDLRQTINPAWPDLDERDYPGLTPDSDISANASLGLSYSRELQGLTERRFSASLNHYASRQNDEGLTSLDIDVTSLRMGLNLPLTRPGKSPLSYDPYISASVLTTDAVSAYSTSGAVGLSINGYATPRNPLAFTLELGDKTHKNTSDENKDGGRHNIGMTLGHIHGGGGYSSVALKFDRTDTDDDFESLNGGTFTVSHSLSLWGVQVGSSLAWRESRRDGFQPVPAGSPQIEKLRYDKDLTANLSFSGTVFGVGVSLAGTYVERDSNIPEAKYDDLSGSLTFSRSFQ